MPKFASIKNTFLAGEISPKAHGRTDLPLFQNGCETMYNFIPLEQGGAEKRPGSIFLSQSPDVDPDIGSGTTPRLNQKSRLIPFVRNDIPLNIDGSGRFLLEFTPYVDDTTHPSGASFRAIGYLDRSDAIYQIAHYFDENGVSSMQYAQSADTMWVVSFYGPPRKITYSGGGPSGFGIGVIGGFLATADSYKRYPFATNVTGTTLSVPAAAYVAGATVTLTASTGIFSPLHAGKPGGFGNHDPAMFIIGSGASAGVVVVTAYTSPTQVTVQVLKDFTFVSATTTWQEQEWSWVRGWPSTVSIFQGRLCYAGTYAKPDGLWFSEEGDYDQMTPTLGAAVLSTDPYDDLLGGNNLNLIYWSLPKKTLQFGTQGDEFIYTNVDPTNSLSTTSGVANVESSIGSDRVAAVGFEHTTMFVATGGRRIREFVFNFEDSAYKSKDISVYADHFPSDFTARYKEIHYDRTRKMIWCLGTDGAVYGVFREKDQDISGWCKLDFGGTVVSMCTMKSFYGTHDDLIFNIVRNIDGTDVVYTEVMGRSYDSSSIVPATTWSWGKDWPIYLDSAFVVNNGSPSTAVTGLDHLEGESVSFLTDGYEQPARTVASGDVTLQSAATNVVAGIPYYGLIKTLGVNPQLGIGTSEGQVKRISKAYLRFYRSLGVQIGPQDTHLEDVIFRPADIAPGTPTPTFTGDRLIWFPGDYEYDAKCVIKTSGPYPVVLAYVVLEGNVNG
jgi:hypothetical protein